jgi:hypothetical protein
MHTAKRTLLLLLMMMMITMMTTLLLLLLCFCYCCCSCFRCGCCCCCCCKFMTMITGLTLTGYFLGYCLCSFVIYDAHIGHAGANSDSTLWKDILLCKTIMEPSVDGWRAFLPPGCFIVADGGYQNTPFSITPFQVCVR